MRVPYPCMRFWYNGVGDAGGGDSFFGGGVAVQLLPRADVVGGWDSQFCSR